MATDALAEPTVNLSTSDGRMEYTVDGEDIDPNELATPGWLDVRRKQSSFMAANQAPASAAISQPSASGSSPKRGQRSPKRRTPVTPLPATDVKIILRPRGGLALATLSSAVLADTIQRQAALPMIPDDQVRIHTVSNFIVVTTPSEERARSYEKLETLLLNGKQYPVSTHIAVPANTITGLIFNIPPDDTPAQIMESVCNYNPDLQILDAKRLNTSNIAQILFQGTRVPFWIRYRSATYRCRPFRRKTEACTTCWRTGHRQDVCPNTQTTPQRCPKCGLPNAPEDHPCSPKCIVCEGPHVTGTAECPRRYQP